MNIAQSIGISHQQVSMREKRALEKARLHPASRHSRNLWITPLPALRLLPGRMLRSESCRYWSVGMRASACMAACSTRRTWAYRAGARGVERALARARVFHPGRPGTAAQHAGGGFSRGSARNAAPRHQRGGPPAHGRARYRGARGGVNYTVNTVRQLQMNWQRARMVFLLGSDQFAHLHLWQERRRWRSWSSLPCSTARAALPPRPARRWRGCCNFGGLPACSIRPVPRKSAVGSSRAGKWTSGCRAPLPPTSRKRNFTAEPIWLTLGSTTNLCPPLPPPPPPPACCNAVARPLMTKKRSSCVCWMSPGNPRSRIIDHRHGDLLAASQGAA